MFPRIVAGLALACAALAAHSHGYKIGAIVVDRPHARFTVAGQTTGGGFMTLHNKGAADRLLSASAPVSERVEMHTMRMEGDVMRMRPLETIELPAGKTVELKPGGLHLMLVGLKAPLKAGERFPLKLKFDKAGELTVDVAVEAPRGAEHKH